MRGDVPLGDADGPEDPRRDPVTNLFNAVLSCAQEGADSEPRHLLNRIVHEPAGDQCMMTLLSNLEQEGLNRHFGPRWLVHTGQPKLELTCRTRTANAMC